MELARTEPQSGKRRRVGSRGSGRATLLEALAGAALECCGLLQVACVCDETLECDLAGREVRLAPRFESRRQEASDSFGH